MRLKRIIFLMVIFQFMLVLPLHAGTIEGRVMCNDGKPLRQGTIRVLGANHHTDNDGYYSIRLKKGRYSFKIEGKRFKVRIYPYDTPRDFYVDCK